MQTAHQGQASVELTASPEDRPAIGNLSGRALAGFGAAPFLRGEAGADKTALANDEPSEARVRILPAVCPALPVDPALDRDVLLAALDAALHAGRQTADQVVDVAGETIPDWSTEELPPTIPEQLLSGLLHRFAADNRLLRAELERVLCGQAPVGFVREEIVESWRRSAAYGVRPDRLQLPYDDDIDAHAPLLRAAQPLVDRLGADLSPTETSVVLSDGRGRVMARQSPSPLEACRLDDLMLSCGHSWAVEHAGTNGLGDACASRRPCLVEGDEHYVEELTTMATAGVPIRDPRTAQVLGALALVCPAGAANALLLPLAGRAGREIEQRLLHGSSAVERLLQDRFLRVRRSTRGPLAVVGRSVLLTNAAGARLFSPDDQPRLWDFVCRRLGAPDADRPAFALADGRTLRLSLEAVLDGGDVAGVLVRLPVPASGGTASAGRRGSPSGSARPTFGWDSLTESERAVIELVVGGLTNREVAARLFLSPHTVDSHLRHIFRKLDINSRLDLVRIVLSRGVAERAMSGADVA